jgi:hypothetical protein
MAAGFSKQRGAFMQKSAIILLCAAYSITATPKTPHVPSWRLEAPNRVVPLPPDPRDPANIEAEDAYFDRWAGAADPLDGPQSIGSGSSGPGEVREDFPAVHEEVFVAHFSNWRSYLSQSRRSIYTIVNLVIDRVVSDKGGHITSGSTVSLAIPGGTVLAPTTEKTLSYFVRYGDFPLEPNTKYLIFLSSSNRPFFEYVQAWNVDKGVLEPITPYQSYRVSHGLASHGLENLEDAARDLTR